MGLEERSSNKITFKSLIEEGLRLQIVLERESKYLKEAEGGS